MKMLVARHEMCLRLVWHFHVCVGDPYYALDCREDDYCWFNTDADGEMVPSIKFLSQIQPGLGDYRYLSTLQRRIAARPDHPNAAKARAVWRQMIDLKAGTDRPTGARRRKAGKLADYEADRQKVIDAILLLGQLTTPIGRGFREPPRGAVQSGHLPAPRRPCVRLVPGGLSILFLSGVWPHRM